MTEYIVFWKEAPGQQVTTVVDAHSNPATRDDEYVESNGVPVLDDEDGVFAALDRADGTHYAITPELARQTLGWDV